MLRKLSSGVARCEVIVAAGLAALVTLLILLNITTRSFGYALYWTDELAIHSMVWMTFLATAVVLKRRESIAVTMLVDLFSPRFQAISKLVTDVIVLFFGGFLLWLCWRWYDPVTLFNSGFDISAFQMDTFNFIYSERTNTLGLPKFWSWLCLPVFSLSLLLHGLVNVTDSMADIRAISRRQA